MSRFPTLDTDGFLLEAEVAPKGHAEFEARYSAATKRIVSPGSPIHYQNQSNKWGAELRVYFNNDDVAATLRKAGLHVEHPRLGYKSGDYKYRANDNELWWELVESHGLHLGLN